MGTLACEGNKKGTTIRKILGGGSKQYGEDMKTVVQKSQAEGCLRVDEVVRAMSLIEEDGLIAYHSDLSIGRNESGDIDGYEPIDDRKFSQDVLLRGHDDENVIYVIDKPTSTQISGNELTRTSFIARFLNGVSTLDKECKTMKLKRSNSAAEVEHKVVKKDGTTLIVQNSATGELIKYFYDVKKDALFITSTRPTSQTMEVCDRKLPALLRSTVTISHQAKGTEIEISYDYASLIAGFVKDSVALRETLSQTDKGSPVRMTGAYFGQLLTAIQSDEFTRQECK
jgi:hypothetical protein